MSRFAQSVAISCAILILVAHLPLASGQDSRPQTRPHAQPQSGPSQKANPYLKNLRQLTFKGEKSGEGYFSADSKSIVYQSIQEGCPHYQIYSQSLSGGEPKLVSPGQGLTTCAYYHPVDGTVLFSSTHLDPTSFGPPPATGGRYVWNKHKSFDVFITRADGKGLRRLTDTPGYDAEGSMSADGKRVVFTSERDGDFEIYTMNSDGSNQKRITNSKGYDGGPFFSADGTKICYRGFRDRRPGFERYATVYVCDDDGKNERQITFNTAVNWAPYFHPNNEYLAYCTNVGGHRNFELILVRLSDLHVVRLTQHQATDIMPVFSPDGKKMMWTTTRYGGKSQLVIADFVMPSADEFQPPYRDPKGGVQPASHGQRPGKKSSGGNPHSRPSSQPSHGAKGASAKIDAQGLAADDCLAHVAELAADSYGGRRPGTEGIAKAAHYIEAAFASLGAKPAGTVGYRHAFGMNGGCRAEEKAPMTIRGGDEVKTLTLNQNYVPLPFTANKAAKGGLVFVGYGVTTPDGKWDDYAGIDAKGKIVICFLRGAPELPAQKRDPHSGLGLYAGSRYKAFNASRHGAAGVIMIADSTTRDRDSLTSLKFAQAESRERIPVVQMRRGEALRIFGAAGLDIEALEIEMRDTNMAQSKALGDGWQVSMNAEVESLKISTDNIVGIIKGHDPVLADEYIVIGAHYDHLGHGGQGSLAPGGGIGQIHNGADDNASGVSGIIELGEYFAKKPLSRSVVLMAFSGEEQGLLGSAAWTREPSLPLENCRAMINLDMIGRLSDLGLAIDGVGTLAHWKALIEWSNLGGLKMGMTEGASSGRSDHASFIAAGIPAVHFFTGAHEDYHRPSDDTEKINAEGMVKVLALVRRTLKALDTDERPIAFTKPKAVAKKKLKSGGYGAYFGSIPDYTQEGGGVKLSGVSAGGPAAKAGLKKGDVLVGLGDIEIENIYDFTNALRSLKPGQVIDVRLKRGDEVMVLKTKLGRR